MCEPFAAPCSSARVPASHFGPWLGFVNNSLQRSKADTQGLLLLELPSFSALIPFDAAQANLLKEANTPALHRAFGVFTRRPGCPPAQVT